MLRPGHVRGGRWHASIVMPGGVFGQWSADTVVQLIYVIMLVVHMGSNNVFARCIKYTSSPLSADLARYDPALPVIAVLIGAKS